MLKRDFLNDVEGLLRALPVKIPVYHQIYCREAPLQGKKNMMHETHYFLTLTAFVKAEDLLYRADLVIGKVDELTEDRNEESAKICALGKKLVNNLQAKFPAQQWLEGQLGPITKTNFRGK